MPEETYVKAWVFFVAIGVSIATSTAAGMLYIETQNVKNLVREETKIFDSKLNDLQEKTVATVSKLANNFTILSAQAAATIQAQAIEIGNYQSQVATLTNNQQALQTVYDTLLLDYNNLQTTFQNTTKTQKSNLNASWVTFVKVFNQAQNKLDNAIFFMNNGNYSFNNAYRNFLQNDTYNHTRCIENSTLSKNSFFLSYNTSVISSGLFNTSLTYALDNWSKTLISHYVHLNRLIMNLTQYMRFASNSLMNASIEYPNTLQKVINLDPEPWSVYNGHIQQMNIQWQLFNTTYVTYQNQLSLINNYM